MNRVFYLSIVAALAGFIFGFDTVVISGADKKLQSLWGSSDFYHGAVVMAMALWGTVLGALAGSYPTNKFGRKNTLATGFQIGVKAAKLLVSLKILQSLLHQSEKRFNDAITSNSPR